jgi:uncharacterized protein
MILKLLLFAIIGIVIYRALGGKVPGLDRDTSSSKELDGDTLVECATCGTYVTLRESISVAGKRYCSKECIPDKRSKS